VKVTRSAIQWTTRTVSAIETDASLPAGKHDGPDDVVKPDCATYYDTTHDDDKPTHFNADDAAAVAAASDAATADDGTNGADAAEDTETAAVRPEWESVAADTAVGPAITAAATVYRFCDAITQGEKLLKFRGGHTYSFKQ
jgi:hypothetical protein